MSAQKYWYFINRIEVEDPVETRRRCGLAEEVIVKAPISIDEFDAMMETIALICRESYHR